MPSNYNVYLDPANKALPITVGISITLAGTLGCQSTLAAGLMGSVTAELLVAARPVIEGLYKAHPEWRPLDNINWAFPTILQFPDLVDIITPQVYDQVLDNPTNGLGLYGMTFMSDRATKSTTEKTFLSITGLARHMPSRNWFVLASPLMSNPNHHNTTNPHLVQGYICFSPKGMALSCRGTEALANYHLLPTKSDFHELFGMQVEVKDKETGDVVVIRRGIPPARIWRGTDKLFEHCKLAVVRAFPNKKVTKP